MRRHGRTDDACGYCTDPVRVLLDAELLDVGQAVVEATLVPEVLLRAADAAVPRLDRERRTLVPAHGGAGVISRRTLAAHLVEAIALARVLVVEGLDELSRVEVRPAIAFVVDALAVECLGPPLTVEVGQLVE